MKINNLAVAILFWTALFLPKNNAVADETGELLTKNLPEFVVTGHYDYFKTKGTRGYVYEVYKDSTLRGRPAIDALGKIPLLEIKQGTSVASVNGQGLEFRINGLNDPILTSPAQALTALPADIIKFIELKEETNADGTTYLEINLVTKGKLEGYRAQISSNVSDSSWQNILWGLSKVKRLTFSGNYYNRWEWGHGSESYSDEYRFDTPDTYRYESRTRWSGYKADFNNVEVSASYDLDDRSFLSVYGRGLFKIRPRTSSSGITEIYDDKGELTGAYSNSYKVRYNDAEYTASLKYERDLTKNRLPGRLNIGYEFYSRPIDNRSASIYDVSQNRPDIDLGFLNIMNSKRLRSQRYATNTLVADWVRETGQHTQWGVLTKFRTRHESYENDITMSPAIASGSPLTEYYKMSMGEYWGSITPKFAYYHNNRWEVRGGFVAQAYLHHLSNSESEQTVNRRKIMILPFVSAAVATKKNVIFRLSYNMETGIPDITSLNPYVVRTQAGELTYGNPDLRPLTRHRLQLEISGRTGKLYTGANLTGSYTKDLSLLYHFITDGVMHNTYGNIANNKNLTLGGYTSGRIHRNTYLRFNAGVEWGQYSSAILNQINRGWSFNLRGSAEQELPWGMTLNVSAYYRSPALLLQGRGTNSFGYDLYLYKSFLNHKLSVSLYADSFLPVWYTARYSGVGTLYKREGYDRSFHASFSLSIRYVFGRLNAHVKQGGADMENNDIRTSYSR